MSHSLEELINNIQEISKISMEEPQRVDVPKYGVHSVRTTFAAFAVPVVSFY
jgi:hypothetical protein